MTKSTDPNRMRELGRRGGKASGEARRKRKTRSFLDVLRDRVNERPEDLVDALLDSAPGAVVAARVLERAGELGGEEPGQDSLSVVPARESMTFPDMVAFVAQEGPSLELAWFGFELTDAQRAIALERWERQEAEAGREVDGHHPADR